MNKSYKIITCMSLLLSLISIASCSGCLGSPYFQIIFENRTQQTVTIYVGDYEVGNVNPEEQITRDHTPWDDNSYPVTAVNLQGETVYSKILTRDDMERIESLVYKITITDTDISMQPTTAPSVTHNP